MAKAKRTKGARPAKSQSAASTLPRAAKGRRPQYFLDPAVDKLHLMVMALIGELSVSRDRIDTLERLIERHKLFDVAEIEAYVPDAKADGERTARRLAYIRRVMKGITDEVAQVTRDDPALEFEQVVATVAK
ncbi:MAG: hypothetical protein FJX65_19150 [Alphaproteobacteria bacterium]|nr:hypothetical protein [Alphaproteobacteria bacterium]